MKRVLFLSLAAALAGGAMSEAKDRSFAQDAAFLKKHTDAIILTGSSGAAVAVVPKYQARVMTSAADAAHGEGFGWINYDHIASGKFVPHINVFGGEDRFWLGPEGGQYSIFFKDLSPFDLDHWQTPAPIDSEAYKVVSKSSSSVRCKHHFRLVNYSGSDFHVAVDRTINLLSDASIARSLGVDMAGLKGVGFETVNTVTNAGQTGWDKMSGTLSIWILGMFKPSPGTTVVLPYNTAGGGTVVNDTYFGKVPSNRLHVGSTCVFFKGDGQMRSKIGIPPQRAVSTLGSYDASRSVLTIVKYSFNSEASDYVNSMWELQDNPFGGDVVNSYNDGPAKPGAKPFGPFYELETSSQALALGPNGSHTHKSTTYHLTGPADKLDKACRALLGVGLDEVVKAL